MKRLAIAAVILAALPLYGGGATLVAPDFVAGRSLPAIEIVDDTGRIRSTEEWRGTPTILAPMYARCPLACPLIAEGLKRAAARSAAAPSR
jgi:cytochrome oxidase Cu insertion factor (SCO1/SenC/PrrC family)